MKNKILPHHTIKKEISQRVENSGFPNFEIQAMKLDIASTLIKQSMSQNRNNIQTSSLKKSSSNLIHESKTSEQVFELPIQSKTPQEKVKPIAKYSKMPSNFDLYTKDTNQHIMPQINIPIANNNTEQLAKSSSCKPLPSYQQLSHTQFNAFNDVNDRRYSCNSSSANTTTQNLKKIKEISQNQKQPPLSKNSQRIPKKPSSSKNNSSNRPQYQQYQNQQIQASFEQQEQSLQEINQQEIINTNQKQSSLDQQFQNTNQDDQGNKGMFNDLFMSGQKLICTKKIPYTILDGQTKNKFFNSNGKVSNNIELAGNYRLENRTLTTSNSNKQIFPKLNQNEISNNISNQQSFTKKQNSQKVIYAQNLQQNTSPELQQQNSKDFSQKQFYQNSNSNKQIKNCYPPNNQQIQPIKQNSTKPLLKQNNSEPSILQTANRPEQIQKNYHESPISDSSEQLVYKQQTDENTPYESSLSTSHSKLSNKQQQNNDNISNNTTPQQIINNKNALIVNDLNSQNNFEYQQQNDEKQEQENQKKQNYQQQIHKYQTQKQTIEPKIKNSTTKYNMTTSGNLTLVDNQKNPNQIEHQNVNENKPIQIVQNENYNNLNPQKQLLQSQQDKKNSNKQPNIQKQLNNQVSYQQSVKQNINQDSIATAQKKNNKYKKPIQEDTKEDQEIKTKIKQEPLTIQQFELNDDFFRESFDGYNNDMELSFSGTWTGYNIQQYMKNIEEEKEQQKKAAAKKQSSKVSQKQKQSLNNQENVKIISQQQAQKNINENQEKRNTAEVKNKKQNTVKDQSESNQEIEEDIKELDN